MGNYKKAEGILDKYSKGKLSAREVQKELKDFGYKADLRGKSNTIPVYPIDGGDGFDVELAKGGAMLQKQMELFDVGGLKDEGGTKDPVSGNDVPVGSTQEEVRDDIPAQLSEGEFVLPADVVRYHGLEKIMALRDEAKAGLAKMEAMGQMGNSEEATLSDDVPFSMDDLELEDDAMGFQTGGFVPPQNVGFVPSQFTPPVTAMPVTPTPTLPAYTPPTQQFVPTMPTQPTPTFGMPQTVTYYHPDGRTIQVPVDSNGNPLIPIPPGFTATKPTADATAPTTPTTTTVGPVMQQQDNTDSGPSIEQQKAEQEYKNTVNQRTKAAEDLGFTKKQSTVEYAASLIPGANLLMDNPTAGTILLDGTIADGNGNSFDPRTGEQVGFTGGIVGDILGKAGLRDEPEPVKFAQNIEDMKKGIGVSDAERADADLAFERLSDVLPKEALPTTRVETALVTEKGTASEIAQKAADIKSSLNLTDMSEKEKIDFLDSVIEGKPASEKLVDREGNPVKFTSAETPEDIASQAAAAQKMKDDIVQEAEERRKSAKETGAEKREEREAAIQAASAYGISATNPNGSNKTVSEIRSEMQAAQKARADAARQRTQEQIARTGGPNIFGGFESGESGESGVQSAFDSGPSGTDFGGAGYETSTGEAMVAEGGLIKKTKLAQQMKQSGLASKK